MSLVYISCKDYIIILQKLDDTITNEDRKKIIDKNYAKFRCNKLKVISIEHKITNEKINEIENMAYDLNKLKYKVGTIINIPSFSSRKNGYIYNNGIYYYLSKEPSYYWQLIEYIDKYSGDYKEWHDNGRIKKICSYIDGIISGNYSEWYDNGKLEKFIVYSNGKIIEQKYYENN